jgi:hypothetical protein
LGSTDNRLSYLDLTGLRARLQHELGDEALAQSSDVAVGNTVRWNGFSNGETACGGVRRWATSPSATIELNNRGSTPITINPSTTFEASPATPQVAISAPGDNEAVPLFGGTGTWEKTLTIPPGKSQIRFSVTGPSIAAAGDPRSLYLALTRYRLGAPFDSPVQQWAGRLPGACTPPPTTVGG